jgi:hypothetical protein
MIAETFELKNPWGWQSSEIEMCEPLNLILQAQVTIN